MSVRVLTDSTSYISEELRKDLNIRVVSLSVSFANEESIKEIEIDDDTFYETMSRKGIPTSSQPNIGELYNEMLSVIEQGEDLCCIFLSSEMSGTYSAGQLAKQMIQEKYPEAKIEIIDSRSTAMQLGFVVLQAARAAKEGKTLEEVKDAALKNIKRSRFLFIPDNLNYLKAGGRIGGASALLGNLFKIIPILKVVEGKVAVLAKVRTKQKAVMAMVDQLLKDIKSSKLEEIAVLHINCLKDAKELAQFIEEKLNIKSSIHGISPVIGMHVGPGAIGIVYYIDKDMR